MVQLFFLSILSCIAGAAALLAGAQGENPPAWKSLFGRRSVKVPVAIAAAVVGLAKLFVRAPFDKVPVVGDLLPALAGIGVGLGILVETLTGAEDARLQSAAKLVNTYRIPGAVVAMAAAVAHFLFPGAVIL